MDRKLLEKVLSNEEASKQAAADAAASSGSAQDVPDKPGEWTAEHRDWGTRRWNGIVTYADDQTLQAFMACNIREYPIAELNANGWRNWEPVKPNPNTHCLMCDGWGALDPHQNGQPVACLECNGTPTRE